MAEASPRWRRQGWSPPADPVAPADRSRRAQRAIQERIKQWILEQGLNSGDSMPTEAELAERLGIGRNSLREALKALQALDIVEVRHGFGTYVGACSLDALGDALVFRGLKSMRGDRHELHEILELREALEAGLIRQVVAAIDDAGVERLASRLRDLERDAGHGQAGDDADRAFHEELSAVLGNNLMRQLLRVFWDVYHDLAGELPTTESNGSGIVEVHRAIFDAVVARDPRRAGEAISDHFAGLRARIRA